MTAVNGSGESGPSNTAEAQKIGFCQDFPILLGASATVMGGGGGDEVVTKYYYAAGQRVAMRRDGVVQYLHTDHLGSTSLATNSSGVEVTGSRTLYYPYGEERWSASGGTLPTDYTFTGQRNEAGIGLMDYNARFYDPYLGRFISPDTIVPDPGNPQDLNRYAYVRNNPLIYTDPSGHCIPGLNCPGDTTWVHRDTRVDLGGAYQSQGRGSNDCGPTSLAVVSNLILRHEGMPGNPVDAQSMGDIMQNESQWFGATRYRVTVDIFGMEGATSPRGMANAFNQFSAELKSAGGPDLGTAEYTNHGTKSDLISNVENDRYATIMLVWEPAPSGGAHWVTVVGYNQSKDEFYLLNPSSAYANSKNPEKQVQSISWKDLESDWNRTLFFWQNVTITYLPSQNQGGQIQ